MLQIFFKKYHTSLLQKCHCAKMFSTSIGNPTTKTENNPNAVNKSEETNDVDTVHVEQQFDSDHDNNKTIMDEEVIESLRNVSRMPKRYRDRMLHVLEPDPQEVNPDYITAMYQKPSFKKMLYASYGKKSGLNPGLLWPSESELKEIIEFEKDWEPSLEKMLETLKTNKETELKKIKEKENLIDAQLAKMPQYIKDYQSRLKKAEEQEKQLQIKRQALLDEARDYFGYQIDPNDPRFEQIKLAKEEEEKKVLKKKKKEEKLAKFVQFTTSSQQ